MDDFTPLSGEFTIRPQEEWFNEPEVTTKTSLTCNQVERGLTRGQKQAIAQRSDDHCVYCGKVCRGLDRTFDHITPRSRVGETSAENCVLSCRSCNSAKCDRTIESIRHHVALRELGWPRMSKEQIEWAERRGADISPYRAWRFWYESSKTTAALATKAVIEAQLASIHEVLSIHEKLIWMQRTKNYSGYLPTHRTPEIDEILSRPERRRPARR